MRRFARRTIVLALVIGVFTGSTALATPNPKFNKPFNNLTTSWNDNTYFTIFDNGGVTLSATAFTNPPGGTNTFDGMIQRRDCGLCGFYTVAGPGLYFANGTKNGWAFFPGNSTKAHRIRLTKANNGVTIYGTVFME